MVFSTTPFEGYLKNLPTVFQVALLPFRLPIPYRLGAQPVAGYGGRPLRPARQPHPGIRRHPLLLRRFRQPDPQRRRGKPHPARFRIRPVRQAGQSRSPPPKPRDGRMDKANAMSSAWLQGTNKRWRRGLWPNWAELDLKAGFENPAIRGGWHPLRRARPCRA